MKGEKKHNKNIAGQAGPDEVDDGAIIWSKSQ